MAFSRGEKDAATRRAPLSWSKANAQNRETCCGCDSERARVLAGQHLIDIRPRGEEVVSGPPRKLDCDGREGPLRESCGTCRVELRDDPFPPPRRRGEHLADSRGALSGGRHLQEGSPPSRVDGSLVRGGIQREGTGTGASVRRARPPLEFSRNPSKHHPRFLTESWRGCREHSRDPSRDPLPRLLFRRRAAGRPSDASVRNPLPSLEEKTY